MIAPCDVCGEVDGHDFDVHAEKVEEAVEFFQEDGTL